MKKVISLILSVIMLTTITAGIDFSAYAETLTGECGDNISYTLDTNTGVLTISGTGNMTNYEGNSPWDDDNSSIKTVIINSGVTSIGDYAFSGLSNLTNVTIGNSVTSIGNYAFEGCSSLTSITIPDSVKYIGSRAFTCYKIKYSDDYYCGIDGGCNGEISYISNLKSVKIGSGVISIAQSAFDNSAYYNDSSNWEDGVLYIGNYLIKASIEGSCSIKDTTTLIADSAFARCSDLTSVDIPNGVTSIGNSAFCNCSSLTSVTIPDSVTNLGANVFGEYIYYDSWDNTYRCYGCDSLKSVSIGSGVTNIPTKAFNGCSSLTSVDIPNSVTSIEDSAFSSCGLISIEIPDSVINIGNSEFYDCRSLTSIIIPDSVKSIGNDAFAGCCSLTNITIPDSVTNIGTNVFGQVELYDDYDNCFYSGYCDSLELVSIGNGVVNIPTNAFIGCSSLVSITISDSIKNIGDSAFASCSSITNIEIPDSVTSIGNSVFEDCNSLTSITLPDSVKEIGDSAFNGCSSLKTVIIGNGILSVPTNTFGGCNALSKVMIKNKDCEIGDSTTISYSTKIYGHNNSKAQEYAIEYNRVFKHLDGYDEIEITKATISKNGSIVKKCSVCGKVDSSTTIYYPKTISLSGTSYVYNGKVKTPSVTVKDSKGNTLKKNTDYTVSYASGRKIVGKYSVKITFKGNYSGSKTLYFYIKPASTSITSLSKGSKKFTVKLKKQSTQTNGYQIQYCTNSKFSNAKTTTITKNSTVSRTVSKLYSKKRYYVRVRTYKTVKYAGKNLNIYSNWSSAKSVVTK